MTISSWMNWVCDLGRPSISAKRRESRDSRRWEVSSETLEGRALLSASKFAPESAEVADGAEDTATRANGKASWVYPNVAGTWNMTFTIGIEGTAVVTQNKKKVSIQMDIDGLPVVFTMKSSFLKKEPFALSDKLRLKIPDADYPVIDVKIVFQPIVSPVSFSAQILGLPYYANITATRQTFGAPDASSD